MINDIDVLDAGAVLTFKCKDGAKLDERLLDRLRENGHLQVFRKDEVPDRFHWKNNRRSADVLVLCDEQYRLVRKLSSVVFNSETVCFFENKVKLFVVSSCVVCQ